MSENQGNEPPMQAGLSQGVVTALAIGCSVLFVLLVIIIILVIILRRMKNNKDETQSRTEKAQSKAAEEDDRGPLDVTDVAQFEPSKGKQLTQSGAELDPESIFVEDKEFNKISDKDTGEAETEKEVKRENGTDAVKANTKNDIDKKRESQTSSKNKPKKYKAPMPKVEVELNDESKGSSGNDVKYKDAEEYYANSKYAKFAEFKEAFREHRRSRHRSMEAENRPSKKERHGKRKRKSRRSETDAYDNAAFSGELKEMNPDEDLVFVSPDSEV
ncbi:uncharacterized protein LOC106160308 [Lingula anatina]|uniref:Uncharacterized protein LOC106160308 n=1 Tax=Lingula anatina TaxID=7574 RepID=A0A1S3I221_LINAN|nr:uncharacterized protein LOC106160308 [Lingula anatina]|eukprot:XP_013392315.1 uncharacterized protein LOC106160308 [Lingula anatina]